MWPSTASDALVRALHPRLFLLLSFLRCRAGQKHHTPCVAGRNFLRCVEGRDDSNLNIVVINDSGSLALLRLPCQVTALLLALHVAGGRRSELALLRAGGVKQASHLLKYDSTLGTFNADVQCVPPLHDATVLAGGKVQASLAVKLQEGTTCRSIVRVPLQDGGRVPHYREWQVHPHRQQP